MSVDVYVGPLARYHTFKWESANNRAAREQGMPVVVYRPNNIFLAPDQALAAVDAWRQWLREAVPELSDQLDWAEDPAGAYLAEQISSQPWKALQALAANAEFPEIPPPQGTDWRLESWAGWKRVLTALGIPDRADRARRWFGRSSPPPSPPRYANLYVAEQWLPVDLDRPLVASDLHGQTTAFGSVALLRRQLDELHARVAAEDPSLLDAERAAGPGARDFRGDAGRGLRVMRTMATAADEGRQPMVLDA